MQDILEHIASKVHSGANRPVYERNAERAALARAYADAIDAYHAACMAQYENPQANRAARNRTSVTIHTASVAAKLAADKLKGVLSL